MYIYIHIYLYICTYIYKLTKLPANVFRLVDPASERNTYLFKVDVFIKRAKF